jgi:hypothetical protein
MLRTYFAPPMTPADVTPNHVAQFLKIGAEANRAVRANRDKACFSAFMSWLIVTGEVPELIVNPCLRGSGVKRNPETEARAVRHARRVPRRVGRGHARRADPDGADLPHAAAARERHHPVDHRAPGAGGRAPQADFVQNKTGRQHKIALTPALDELIPRPDRQRPLSCASRW